MKQKISDSASDVGLESGLSGFKMDIGWILGLLAAALLWAPVLALGATSPKVIVQYRTQIMTPRILKSELYNRLGVNEVEFLSGAFEGWEILTLDEAKDPRWVARELRSYSFVQSAGPSKEVEGLALTQKTITRPPIEQPPFGVRPIGADPDLNKNWGIKKIGVENAWKTSTGDRQLIVAVVDSGVDYNHPDIIDNIWRNPTPSAEGDRIGYNFYHNDGLPYDDVYLDMVGHIGHGTAVSGIIGATGNNARGTSGVAQNVALMPLKFLGPNNRGSTANAIRALEYAVNHGARIINNSWGGPGYEDILYQAIKVVRDRGILFTATPGNSAENNDVPSTAIYPASYPLDNIISVTMSDRNDEMPRNSGYGGKSVHLQAPGRDIFTLAPNNSYRETSGTSISAPFVAGAAALLMSRRPDWSYLQVRDAILKTVTPVKWRPKDTITGGRLDVRRALDYAASSP